MESPGRSFTLEGEDRDPDKCRAGQRSRVRWHTAQGELRGEAQPGPSGAGAVAAAGRSPGPRERWAEAACGQACHREGREEAAQATRVLRSPTGCRVRPAADPPGPEAARRWRRGRRGRASEATPQWCLRCGCGAEGSPPWGPGCHLEHREVARTQGPWGLSFRPEMMGSGGFKPKLNPVTMR